MINFQSSGKRTLKNLAAGKLKIDVLDCTLANGSVTPTIPGINWIPIKPATNAAFCAALVQKIIADKTYNADVLSFPQQKAAEAAGYGAFTNAAYLVIVDENHPNYRKLMRAADAGIDAPEEKDKDGKAVEQYVVIDAATGQPALHSACSKGTLEFEGEVNGVAVRTGFSLLTETVNEYTMDEYAEITGVSVEDLERIAREYTSHGTRVGICHKGGSAASVNGIDTVMGAAVLHAIVGANQMIGGNAPNSPAPTTTGNGKRYKLGAIEGKPDVSTKNACYISRTVKAWKKTDEYKNRVAAGEKDPKPLMPWFANGAASDSQALLSIVNKYPYQAKILTSFMCNTIQATPGAMRDEVVERLCDPEVLPLLSGLHFHTLCEQDSDALETTLNAVEARFGELFPGLRWLNFGGGHHITRPGYDIPRLERCIDRIQQRYGLQVYLEPGEAVALNAGILRCTVLDIVENGGKIAILDTSAACHMPDVLEMPYRPPLRGSGLPGEKAYSYRLGGPTCLAGDIIGDYSFDRPLAVGDVLEFGDMAIYSMVKNNTFNGMPLPSIALRTLGGTERCIRSFGYEDFKQRLS